MFHQNTSNARNSLPPADRVVPCAILLIHLGGTGLSVAPDGVHLLSDYTGRASGEAFVHFLEKGHAPEALDRDREKIGHRWGDLV